MSNILHQRDNAVCNKTLAVGFVPVSLTYAPGEQTSVQFSNGVKAKASCLRCIDAPCIRFSNFEVIPENFRGFPADQNPEICAAGAISQPEGGGAPSIDGDRCLFCGVCSSRCPVGAIRLIEGKGAVVDDSPNEAFVEEANVTQTKNIADQDAFYGLPAVGAQLIESDTLVDDVFDRLQTAWKRVGDRFPNLLARNLLIGAGVSASLGRKGNNHMRMDLILSPPGVERGVAEVEFGQDATLDTPRDILDAMAVLTSRYGWELNTTVAIIITDVLPNRRSEYWHIIQDINNVFQIRVGTVTILALMLFNWNRWTLKIGEEQPFYADRNTASYRTEVLELLIGRVLHLGTAPRPQVDIAK
jgi:Fe-S-cluster-containing hydrogenase component 2